MSALRADQLMDVIWGTGITADFQFRDSQYDLPRLEFIDGPDFKQSVRTVMEAFDSVAYAEESNDCDDRADIVQLTALRLHNRTRSGGSGLAIGVMTYLPEGANVLHRLNPVIGIPKGKTEPVMWFFDWDAGGYVNLTQAEIDSCNYFAI